MNALTPINSNQTAGISLGIPATATSILTDDDLQKVEALAAQIDLSSPTAASGFGKEIYTESGEMTDALLQRIRSSDTDVIGSRLNEVLQLARETNSNIDFTPKNTRERLYKVIVTTPVIGTLAKRMTRTVRSQIDRYESAAHQIDSVVAELDSAFDTIEQTNQLLDQNFAEVVERNRILEIHIQAGHRALAAYQQQLDEPMDGSDPMQVQIREDRASAAAIMEKRVVDLVVLQQNGYQTLTSIRMIQANNRQVSEKFHTIRQVTIPAWKQGFVIRGALTQQRHAVSLTEAIDHTTNELLLQNADLLHANSVRTAKANQRLIIDPETLIKTGKMLITTTQEVIAIRREGQATREQSIKQLEEIRKSQSAAALALNPRSEKSVSGRKL
ncbi:hypothetical protein BAE47_12680 [Acidithiobacillus thiooxidans]|uniref:toxic anion resistance protein n=2 Tax=Acidithiobacillus thiooxidans TaxID=930 RepID=UPI00046435AA|nr:toxic anion resistance protein [Acidithiobacillus thiooxidans]OCX83728.1 hypothetical protein A6O26_06445 [Acidithiobacillus thiooxidans]OFC43629.1 hypothetical protein BAE47_12680 [Acidithiobacillus thiooxidans]